MNDDLAGKLTDLAAEIRAATKVDRVTWSQVLRKLAEELRSGK